MPKIADILPSVKNSNVCGDLLALKLAHLLGVGLAQAEELYSQYGDGYIYARTGLALPLSERVKRNVIATFGWCVVATDGDVFVVSSQLFRDEKKRTDKISRARERHEFKRFIRERSEKKRTDRMFRDGQGAACPKHGGKANSHEDIGKYVDRPAYHVVDYAPKSVTVTKYTVFR